VGPVERRDRRGGLSWKEEVEEFNGVREKKGARGKPNSRQVWGVLAVTSSLLRRSK